MCEQVRSIKSEVLLSSCVHSQALPIWQVGKARIDLWHWCWTLPCHCLCRTVGLFPSYHLHMSIWHEACRHNPQYDSYRDSCLLYGPTIRVSVRRREGLISADWSGNWKHTSLQATTSVLPTQATVAHQGRLGKLRRKYVPWVFRSISAAALASAMGVPLYQGSLQRGGPLIRFQILTFKSQCEKLLTTNSGGWSAGHSWRRSCWVKAVW